MAIKRDLPDRESERMAKGIVGGWLGGGLDRINKMAEFQDFFLKGGAAAVGTCGFNPEILEFC